MGREPEPDVVLLDLAHARDGRHDDPRAPPRRGPEGARAIMRRARRRRPCSPPSPAARRATSPSAQPPGAVRRRHHGARRRLVIAPHLAGHLLRQYQKASRGETDNLHDQLTRRARARGAAPRGHGLHRPRDRRGELRSPRTVQNHLARIRDKTGLRRRCQLTRWAVVHAVY